MLTLLTRPPLVTGSQAFSKSNPLLQDARWMLRVAQRLAQGRGFEVRFPGHSGVTGSLMRGLDKLGQPYRLNPFFKVGDAPIGVLAGIRALQWAVGRDPLVSSGDVVVGPNVSVVPSELPQAFLHERVRTVVVPSEWVLNYWIRNMPDLAGRLRVWPCGVDFDFWRPSQASHVPKLPLIYTKVDWPGLGEKIKVILSASGMGFREISYGRYSPSMYRAMLSKSSCVVYLGGSESQGIALLEAWAMDVPTFVFDAPSQEIPLPNGRSDVLLRGDFSPAPYLTEEFGSMWTCPYEVPDLCASALFYTPRRAAKAAFSDETRAAHYLEMFKGQASSSYS